MVNGNDYLEIEEEQSQRIEEDYIKAIKEGTEEIPSQYKFCWVSSYLEGP